MLYETCEQAVTQSNLKNQAAWLLVCTIKMIPKTWLYRMH